MELAQIVSALSQPIVVALGAAMLVATISFLLHRYLRNPFAHMNENELFVRLKLAVIDEEEEVARQILKLGKVKNLDRYTMQSTLLCITSRGGSSEMFKMLIEHGADPNARTQKGDTPLICAARNGHIECLEHLLALGVDVNSRGHRGWTALHWASLNGRYEIAATLVAFGADIDCLTDEKSSCIFLACLSGHSNLVQDLGKFGSNIFTVDIRGDTPLHAAARQNGSSVRVLLSANAAYQRNLSGETPIDVALVRGHRRFIDILLMSRPHLRTNFHKEALLLACSNCHNVKTFQNIMKVLSELSALELSHFECTVEQIVVSLVSLFPLIISQSASLLPSSFPQHPVPMTAQPAPSKSDPPSSSEPLSSSDISLPSSSNPQEPLTESAITQFRHLCIALVNLTQDVFRTPKISALLKCSDLRSKIQSLLEPLDSVWNDLETYINQLSSEWERSDKSEDTKAQLYRKLGDIPSVIDQFYSISRMTLANAEVQEWDQGNTSGGAVPHIQNETRSSSFKFLSFIDRTHDGLRLMISSDQNLLSGHLHFLLDLPTNVVSQRRGFSDLIETLSFEQKRNWLRIKIETEQSSAKTGSKIVSDRLNASNSTLLDCARSVLAEKPEDLRGKLFIKFEGEMGVGAGVQREWFQFMTESILSESTGLFNVAPDRVSYVPISDSKENINWTKSERAELYTFFGRLLAIAIVHEDFLHCKLALPLLKSVLHHQYDIEDVQEYDETVYKSMKWILSNPGVEDLCLSFEATSHDTSVTHDIIPNGSNTPVTDSNKELYVQNMTNFIFEKDFELALSSIRAGFYDIIPVRYIAPLKDEELGMLITGHASIDIEDWMANTDYSGELDASSDLVLWFWDWMKKQPFSMHQNVLQFVTGSRNVPLGGFKSLRGVDSRVKFNITRAPKDNGALPTASTCFNMLKLPNFASQSDFESKMEVAVLDGRLGFSFN